MTKLIYI